MLCLFVNRQIPIRERAGAHSTSPSATNVVWLCFHRVLNTFTASYHYVTNTVLHSLDDDSLADDDKDNNNDDDDNADDENNNHCIPN